MSLGNKTFPSLTVFPGVKCRNFKDLGGSQFGYSEAQKWKESLILNVILF